MAHAKKSKKKVIVFSVLGAVLLILALLVILGSKKEDVVSVQTEEVKSRTLTQTVLATGKIYPEVQVLISPEVSGEIIDLPVKEGMRALELLRGVSDLDWTYFSPAAFIEPGSRTGKFRLGEDQLVSDSEGKSRISFEDYAVALVDELEKPAHIKRRFTIGY